MLTAKAHVEPASGLEVTVWLDTRNHSVAEGDEEQESQSVTQSGQLVQELICIHQISAAVDDAPWGSLA